MATAQSQGARLIREAEDLILGTLANTSEGMTNAEIARATGLDVPVARQTQYISWSLLRHLVESGRLVKDGRRYRLVE